MKKSHIYSNVIVERQYATDPNVIRSTIDYRLPSVHELGTLGLSRYALGSIEGETFAESRVGHVYDAIAGDPAARDSLESIYEYLLNQHPEVARVVRQASELYSKLPEWIRSVRAVNNDDNNQIWGTATHAAKLDYTTWSAVLLTSEQRAEWLQFLLGSFKFIGNSDIKLAASLDDIDTKRRLLHEIAESRKSAEAVCLLSVDFPNAASEIAFRFIKGALSDRTTDAHTYNSLIDVVLPSDSRELHELAAARLKAIVAEDPSSYVANAIMDKLPDDLRAALSEEIQVIITSAVSNWKALDEYKRRVVVELLPHISNTEKGQILESMLKSASPDDHSTFLMIFQLCQALPDEATRLIKYVMLRAKQNEEWMQLAYNAMCTIGNLPHDELEELINWTLDKIPLGISTSVGVVNFIHELPEDVIASLSAKARVQVNHLLANHMGDEESDSLDAAYWALEEIGMDEADKEMRRKWQSIIRDEIATGSAYDIEDAVRKIGVLPIHDRTEFYTLAIARLFEIFETKKDNYLQTNLLFKALTSVPEEYRSLVLQTLGQRGPIGQLVAAADISSSPGPVRNLKPKNGDLGEVYGDDGEKMVRIVPMTAFDAWLRAYLDESWDSIGLNYIPIEPIGAVARADETTMNVAVQTIKLRGGSLQDTLFRYTPVVISEILKMYSAICEHLKEVVGISHGHIFDGKNFVLVPQMTNGIADPGKLPRLYIIDFDMAMSHKMKSTLDLSRGEQYRHTLGPSGA